MSKKSDTGIPPNSPDSPPRLIAHMLGPGLIAGASDDDPSGIATYSQMGAQFGYDTGWTLLFSYPLMCAIQLISAQIGRVTGRGLAGNLRRYYPKSILYALVFLLLIANIINIGADLGAMGAALQLLVGGPSLLYVAGFALLSCILEVFVTYERYVSVLKWLTLSLFAYVATVFATRVPWGRVAHDLVLPHIQFTNAYITGIVAIFGTTISPYLFFWQAEEEVEQERGKPGPNALKKTPEKGPAELKRIRIDTFIGMFFSNLVALFIIITTAATLNASGHVDIKTSSEAAEALRPIAGQFAYTIFALGIIGTGMLALPVLAGSAAYALGETMDWNVGLDRKPNRARAFYGTIAAATLIGFVLNTISLDPIKALFWSAVINGVVAVPVMGMLMLMASSKKIMGRFTIKSLLKILGWTATFLMAVIAVAMIVT